MLWLTLANRIEICYKFTISLHVSIKQVNGEVMEVFSLNLQSYCHSFVRRHQTDFLIQDPSIKICLLSYNERNYDDSHFPLFSVPFPSWLLPAEKRRRSEYLAGRIAAQSLLKENNISNNLAHCKDRIPIWPEGWVGSISHTEQHAISVIAPEKSALYIGIDIEKLKPRLFKDVEHLFTTKDERKFLEKCDLDYDFALFVTFSAKESLYKAIYHKAKKPLDFESMIIKSIDINSQSFIMFHINHDISCGQYYSGKFYIYKENIITIIYAAECNTKYIKTPHQVKRESLQYINHD